MRGLVQAAVFVSGGLLGLYYVTAVMAFPDEGVGHTVAAYGGIVMLASAPVAWYCSRRDQRRWVRWIGFYVLAWALLLGFLAMS